MQNLETLHYYGLSTLFQLWTTNNAEKYFSKTICGDGFSWLSGKKTLVTANGQTGCKAVSLDPQKRRFDIHQNTQLPLNQFLHKWIAPRIMHLFCIYLHYISFALHLHFIYISHSSWNRYICITFH